MEDIAVNLNFLFIFCSEIYIEFCDLNKFYYILFEFNLIFQLKFLISINI